MNTDLKRFQNLLRSLVLPTEIESLLPLLLDLVNDRRPAEGAAPLSVRAGAVIEDLAHHFGPKPEPVRAAIERTSYTEPPLATPSQSDVLDRFRYHAPHGDQVDRYGRIREASRLIAELILFTCPPSRERSLSLTHLDSVGMFANASIARHEPNPDEEDALSPQLLECGHTGRAWTLDVEGLPICNDCAASIAEERGQPEGSSEAP